MDIAQIDNLLSVVRQLGLPEDEARQALASRRLRAAVDVDWQRCRDFGITAVPTFVVGNLDDTLICHQTHGATRASFALVSRLAGTHMLFEIDDFGAYLMNLPLPAILVFALVVCPRPTLSAAMELPDAPRKPVRIVFDTDMDIDCDDLGALAVLPALADLAEAEILATVVSSKNPWSPAYVAAVNTYYGRPDLPVGQPKGAGADRPSRYTWQIAERFPQQLGTGQQVPDAAEIYRRVLSEQPDASAVVVTVGYLTNLADLLRLPADGDRLSGKALVQQKMKRWVCMGGNFVGSPAVDDLALGNNNFTTDSTVALYAVRNWPGSMTFVGREIGSVPSGLRVGARLEELPDDHPVRVGYALYFGGQPRDIDPKVAAGSTAGSCQYGAHGSAGLSGSMMGSATLARKAFHTSSLARPSRPRRTMTMFHSGMVKHLSHPVTQAWPSDAMLAEPRPMARHAPLAKIEANSVASGAGSAGTSRSGPIRTACRFQRMDPNAGRILVHVIAAE